MTSDTPEKKAGLIQRSKDLLDTAVGGLKGKDMNLLVDEFTSEMTLVAEGLSEDLIRTQQQVEQLSASQTLEEAERLVLAERLEELQRRVQTLEKGQEKALARKGTLTGVLRQITVIAAILAAAWVITALLKTFGG
jgi:Flp pilus assembly protein TadB